MNGLPGPGRYDVASTDLLIIYPTLAAAVRVTKWLDIGAELHLVVAKLTFQTVALVDLGRASCPTGEYVGCDSATTLDLMGVTATASIGAMFHPMRDFSIGLHLRGPVDLMASGTANGTPPAVKPLIISPEDATFETKLPWVLRLGLRYAFVKNGFEHGDVEVDGTYEAWAQAQGDGPKVNIPNLSIFTDITPTVTHHFLDTFSVRIGGAYNLKVGPAVLTFRIGFMFDSAATHYADTRLDFDTGAKYMPAAGVGFRIRGIALNLAYAYIFEPDRDVTNGDIRVINPVNHGSNVSSDQVTLTPVVNNGHYHAETEIVSISLNIAWDEALKRRRVLAYE